MVNRQPTAKVLLTDSYLRGLHKAMFGDVWSWAGSYRRTNPNIGCEWHLITANVRSLLGDVAYWIKKYTYPLDEIAVRFHHRLVAIHPFPNGNGRHSRLAAGYLATALGARPTWGAAWACRYRTCEGSTSRRWSRPTALTTSPHSSHSP